MVKRQKNKINSKNNVSHLKKKKRSQLSKERLTSLIERKTTESSIVEIIAITTEVKEIGETIVITATIVTTETTVKEETRVAIVMTSATRRITIGVMAEETTSVITEIVRRRRRLI